MPELGAVRGRSFTRRVVERLERLIQLVAVAVDNKERHALAGLGVRRCAAMEGHRTCGRARKGVAAFIGVQGVRVRRAGRREIHFAKALPPKEVGVGYPVAAHGEATVAGGLHQVAKRGPYVKPDDRRRVDREPRESAGRGGGEGL